MRQKHARQPAAKILYLMLEAVTEYDRALYVLGEQESAKAKQHAEALLGEAARLVRQLSCVPHRPTLRAAIKYARSCRGLSDSLDAAKDAARVADQVRHEIGRAGAADTRVVGRLVVWLARWAVCVLPAVSRERYREEYEAELLELAQESRVRQWVHAIRLMVRTIPLRWELRRPAAEQVR